MRAVIQAWRLCAQQAEEEKVDCQIMRPTLLPLSVRDSSRKSVKPAATASSVPKLCSTSSNVPAQLHPV